mgnify:CR=1 FL=1
MLLVDNNRNRNNNEKYSTLLGVTGSGKTFTMANIIQEVKMPIYTRHR